MTTLLYLVKDGDDNEELRYSLRSLANFPHDRVVFVGHRPSWVRDVDLIPGNRSSSKWLNVFENLLIAAREIDEFVVMNDDFMVMRPVEGAPAWHRGSLTGHILSVQGSGPWKRSLQATRRWLQHRGVRHPLSYELHVPVAMNGRRLATVLSLFDLAERDLPQWRTVYGNFWGVESTQHPDCKIRRDGSFWDDSWPFLSTDEAIWDSHPAGAAVRAAFPDPSPYEEV